MANIDFTGLIDKQEKTSRTGVDFSGLMDEQPVAPTAPAKTRTFSQAGVLERQAAAEGRIEERGNLWGNIESDLQSGNLGRTARGLLGGATSSIQQIEGGVANPVLEMQRGNFNPLDLAKESIAGFTGRKQGEYGDAFKVAGVPPIAADIAGLGISILPFHAVSKSLKGLSKITDRNLIKGGNNVVRGMKEAEKYTGRKVGETFSKFDDIVVDGKGFLDEVAELPGALIKKVEKVTGANIENMAQNLTIGKIREFKRILGKYKPTSFARKEMGAAETIQADEIEAVYGFMKRLMKTNLESNVGKKTSNVLMNVEKAFSGVRNAAKEVRSTIMNKNLRKPTKIGELAEKIESRTDLSARDALNTLRGGGRQAKRQITSAIDNLTAFNNWQKKAKLIEGIARAGVLGGVGGYIGSKIIRGSLGKAEGPAPPAQKQ